MNHAKYVSGIYTFPDVDSSVKTIQQTYMQFDTKTYNISYISVRTIIMLL
jgi:hypothetical protein